MGGEGDAEEEGRAMDDRRKQTYEKMKKLLPVVLKMNRNLEETVTAVALRLEEEEARAAMQATVLKELGIDGVAPLAGRSERDVSAHAAATARRVLELKAGAPPGSLAQDTMLPPPPPRSAFRDPEACPARLPHDTTLPPPSLSPICVKSEPAASFDPVDASSPDSAVLSALCRHVSNSAAAADQKHATSLLFCWNALHLASQRVPPVLLRPCMEELRAALDQIARKDSSKLACQRAPAVKRAFSDIQDRVTVLANADKRGRVAVGTR
ncbi:hypothetical protein DIPPA_06424 [Diplonema papillatum]|nr:hypothetical protein DIPPA_06424 [Diplonema papillatum]